MSPAETLKHVLSTTTKVKITRNGVPLSSRILTESRNRLLEQVDKKDVTVTAMETGNRNVYHLAIGMGSYTVVF